MRIHLVVAAAVVVASACFHFTTVEFCILIITIGMVFAAELINTAIEAAIDRSGREYHQLAKLAKDTAAAAVLVCAVVSLGVACVLFGNRPEGWSLLFERWFSTPGQLALQGVLWGAALAFIFAGPQKIGATFAPKRRK